MSNKEQQNSHHPSSSKISAEQMVLDNEIEFDLFDSCLDIDLGVEIPLLDAFSSATMTSPSNYQEHQQEQLQATTTTSASPSPPSMNEISEEESLTSESDSGTVTLSSTEKTPLPAAEDDQIIVDIEDLPKKPKRSLSAYNLFFKAERELLLKALPPRQGKCPRKSHGKMGFAEMARNISSKWKQIGPQDKLHFTNLAKQDFVRYEREMAAWRDQMKVYPAYMMTKQYQKKLKMNATLKQKKTTTPKSTPKKNAKSAKKSKVANNKTSVKEIDFSDESIWNPPTTTLNSIVDGHLFARDMESV